MESVGSWMALNGRREAAHRIREEFFERTGRVNEDDRSFETRMNAFLEYLLLDHRLEDPRGPETWLEAYVVERAEHLSVRERALLASLSAGHRSLFRLIARPAQQLHLSDMLYGGQWLVALPAALLGLELGDVFEARLVSLEGRVVLLHSVLHHPSDAAPLVARIVEKGLDRGEDPQVLAGRLSAMLLRHDRYPGMNLLQAYGW